MQQRIFRVFVSSTFSDFSAERNVLQKIVFPKLEEKCRDVGGAFLGVDLRWGISPQLSLSNRTLTTCLEEIHRCQALSPKPNFLILLGDRYGWVPLPETIPDEEWAILLTEMSSDEVVLLKAWYDRDENADPHVWILKPRTGEWEDQKVWEERAETPMRNTFRRCAGVLPEERRLAYRGAATHQEILRGLFNATEDGHVVAWCRKLTGAPEGFCSEETQEELGLLKSEVLARVSERGLERVVGYDQIERFQGPSSVVAETMLTPYLREFADWVTEMLWSQIAAEASGTDSKGIEELQEEFINARAQGVVGRENEVRAVHQFISELPGGVHLVNGPGGQGKTSLLALACRELEAESVQRGGWVKRFAGAGGGIDSIEAMLASLIPDLLCDQFWERDILPKLREKRVYPAYRLKSDIREKVGLEKVGLKISFPEFPKESNNLEESENLPEKVSDEKVAELFVQTKTSLQRLRSDLIVKIVSDIGAPRYEYLATYLRFVRYLKGCKLVLVLDGIDQWYGAPDFLETLERLARAGDDTLEGIWLVAAARTVAGVALEGLGQDAWESIAKCRLAQHRRNLYPKQWDWVESGWERTNGNPLSLRVGLAQALRLHSFDGVPKVGFEYRELLRYWIDNIASENQHGELASRALAFLSVAEFGLPESVLLELLAEDKAVRDWFGIQVEKTGQVWELNNGLPPILWSRLQMELGDVIVISGEAGRNILRLFHPAFRDELAAIIKAGLGERNAIAGVAERYLAKCSEGFAEGGAPVRLYEKADPWALKEVVAQWRYVAPAKLDAFMEQPAFAFAVVAHPGAFDAWTDAEESLTHSATLRALLKRHQTELRLQASCFDRFRLILQEVFENVAEASDGALILSWVNEVEFPWVRNLNASDYPKPIVTAPVKVGKTARASNRRLAMFLKEWDVARLAVLNPRRFDEAPLFMTVHKEWYGAKRGFRTPEFEDFIELGDLFVTRHSDGPIRVWRDGTEVVRFVCDQGRDSGASSLCAKSFAKLSAEEILVLYEGGMAAILNFSNLQFDEGEPVLELKASGSGCRFQVVHQESDLDDDEAGGRRWVGLSNKGNDFSLVLMKSAFPILVHHADGATVVSRGQNMVHHGFDGFSLVCGLGWAAFWSLNSDAMILMTVDGERVFNAPGKNAAIIPIACSDSRRTLYCTWYSRDDSQGQPKNIDRLVALDWEAASMRWQGPAIKRHRVISAGEFSYLLFEKEGSLAILRLGDETEPQVVPLDLNDGFWPDAQLFDAASGLIIASSGRRLVLIEPESGACSMVMLESHINDFELIDGLIAIAHGDGELRTYRLDDIKGSAAGESLHSWAPTCIAPIGEKHLITASADRWLLWQADSPGLLLKSVLWETGSTGKERRIYHASPLDNGCVTWGDEIVFWKLAGKARGLEEEHKIWDTGGGSLYCNGMVLELGGNDFLFEYGSDYHDIPGKIGRVRWTGLDGNGEWQENSKWVDDIFAAHVHEPHRPQNRVWRSIISPVFPDGWVLFGETSEPTYAQTETVAAYNTHTEETRVGMAGGEAADPWLVELLERHRGWISTLMEKRADEMLLWGGGVTSEGGAVDMHSIYDFGMRPLTENAESIVRSKQFQKMTTQRKFMFRDMLGMTMPSQRDIGFRAVDGLNVPYISSSSFKVETSMVSDLGMAIVTDSSGQLHWLQLMHGSRPCVGKNSKRTS